MEGDYDRAAELYQSSLELHPNRRSSHVFSAGPIIIRAKLMDANRRMQGAPSNSTPIFGNPLQRHWRLPDRNSASFDEAVPWLQQAVESRRYEPRHFSPTTISVARYLGKEMYGQAMRCFQEAIQIETALFARSASAGIASPHGQLSSSIIFYFPISNSE